MEIETHFSINEKSFSFIDGLIRECKIIGISISVGTFTSVDYEITYTGVSGVTTFKNCNLIFKNIDGLIDYYSTHIVKHDK